MDLGLVKSLQGAGLGKGDMEDNLLLSMQQVPPLHLTGVIQGKAKSPYSLTCMMLNVHRNHQCLTSTETTRLIRDGEGGGVHVVVEEGDYILIGTLSLPE